MPISRFPKQALTMLQNDIETNHSIKHNWAGDIKACLDSYGFHTTWTNGVGNEAAFLALFKRKMLDRFQQEWCTKISNSERFATYRIFKSVHNVERYLNDITIKKFRDSLVRMRLGLNELNVNKRYQSDAVSKDCVFCPQILEDEYHFLFSCPVYADIRYKHIAEFFDCDPETALKSVFVDSCMVTARKLAMFSYYALKRREERLAEL
jgi:hypothetical protein